MRTLVTGAGGFLGHYIVEQLLARGDRCGPGAPRARPSWPPWASKSFAATCATAAAVGRACQASTSCFTWPAWPASGGLAALLRDQHARHRERDRRLPRTARRPAGLHQQPQRHVRRPPQRGVDERAPTRKRWLCHYPHTKALAEQAVLAANGPWPGHVRLAAAFDLGPARSSSGSAADGAGPRRAGCGASATARTGST